MIISIVINFLKACKRVQVERGKAMKYKQYVEQSIREFEAYKPKWNYEDGCVLQGSAYLYDVTGDELFKDFIMGYLEEFISEDGSIQGYSKEEYNIDSVQAGRILFHAMQWYPEAKQYRIAADTIREQLDTQPRLSIGNFWHKKIYPYQLWLDGLYMGQPFYAKYDTVFGNKENYRDIQEQFENVRTYLYNEDKKLYIHAYDEKKEQAWADPVTGHSPNFWLRAIAWYLIGMVDTYDEIDEMIFEVKESLIPLYQEAVEGLLEYQDEETGLFYDLPALPDLEGNYLETSGSLLIAYSILKACRLGMLDKEKYEPIGRKMLQSVHDRYLVEEDGKLKLTSMVEVSGLGPGEQRDGSIEYYLSEPIVADDHKGMGALFMAWSELLRLDGGYENA